VPTPTANRPTRPSEATSQNNSYPNPDLKQESVRSFQSILFDDQAERTEGDEGHVPEFFGDLNLDRIVDSITADREEYRLKRFFYLPLRRPESIHCRQDVFHDLENPGLLQLVRLFAEGMRNMRAHLALSEKRYYKIQKQAAFLDAAEAYCNAILELKQDWPPLLQIRADSRDSVTFCSAIPPRKISSHCLQKRQNLE